MTKPSPIRLSASAVRDFNVCPYRYAKTYLSPILECERETTSILTFGEIVHQVVADFVRLGGWTAVSKVELFAMLRKRWRRDIYADDDLSFANFDRAAAMLERFFDFPYPKNVSRELGIEHWLSWNRAHKGILATGRVDRSCLLQDGALEIIDYKTGCRPPDVTELANDPQALFLRSLAATGYRGISPVAIKVSFFYLPTGMPLTINFDHNDFLQGWRRIEEVASSIRFRMNEVISGKTVIAAFPPNRGKHCSICPIRRHCNSASPFSLPS